MGSVLPSSSADVRPRHPWRAGFPGSRTGAARVGVIRTLVIWTGLIRTAWILAGAILSWSPGQTAESAPTNAAVSAPSTASGTERSPLMERARAHWAFQRLSPSSPPVSPGASRAPEATPVDRFLWAALSARGLGLGPLADPATRLRRLALGVTGLPPTPEEIEAFSADVRRDPAAADRWLERFLGRPAYAERWAQHWLDASGYADSNGYFNADSDRPLAHRYRDRVIASVRRDQPFDQWVREQLAGDELAGWKPGDPVTPEIRGLLEATHFLRNGQDGSGESDGNPDEVRADRYYALEACQQIIGSSLLGLTVQCAKCHDHKFEPFTQRDYYALQAFFHPAYPIDDWVKPNDRVVEAPLEGEREAWQVAEQRWAEGEARARADLTGWLAANRPPIEPRWEDRFDAPAGLAARWSDTAPGDDRPAGSPPVVLGGSTGPAARVQDGVLQLIEGGGPGDRWLCTRESFGWRPPEVGGWIQVGFDLVALQVGDAGGEAARIGYVLAARDFSDSGPVAGGNLLIDGNPGGPSAVHLDYPGPDSKSLGAIGGQGYRAGRRYGVRITRLEQDRFALQHQVDGLPDGKPLTLSAADLPDGGFAFEFCCGRSFQVDQVRVETSPRPGTAEGEAWKVHEQALAAEVCRRDERLAVLQAQRLPRPGRVAWVSDVRPTPGPVPLLLRGNPKTPGEAVPPAFPAFLGQGPETHPVAMPTPGGRSSGRRLAWAHWLTAPGSPQAALLGRVTVNRVWQQCWGTGLVETPDNLGLSGAAPSHPELLDWLAADFIDSGWSLRHLLRRILGSHAFHQSSAPRADGLAVDPSNRGLWRYPVHRLDAEALRDLMLAAAGVLDPKSGGPYVTTPRNGEGEVLVDESVPGARARSLFLQRRRTQVPTLLANFDAPSVVFNCTRRARTTMPLQALSLLNSDFTLRRSGEMARRLERESGPGEGARVRRAFLLACGREPDPVEAAASLDFLARQRGLHATDADPAYRALADLCQSLLALNDCLYLR
ncbi:MAG: DUF1553 domain-containing protein [Verrucomicrobia bacterium]|nr:DUF1553 domain-containing protein [Verrucomicrobiota bacterium]